MKSKFVKAEILKQLNPGIFFVRYRWFNASRYQPHEGVKERERRKNTRTNTQENIQTAGH